MPRPRSAAIRSPACWHGSWASPAGQPRSRGSAGLLPFDIRLAACACATADGVWLRSRTRGCRSGPRPFCAARSPSSRSVRGGWRSTGCPRRHAEPEPFTLPQLPDLPTCLPRIVIDRLFVDSLELGAPVLGEAAIFALAGEAPPGPTASAPTARLGVAPHRPADRQADTRRRRPDLPARTFAIDLAGEETGGLLAAATGRPRGRGTPALARRATARCPNWQGKLAVDAERLAKLEPRSTSPMPSASGWPSPARWMRRRAPCRRSSPNSSAAVWT